MRVRGFTLLELAIVVIAVGVIVGFALDRALPLIGRAQRIAFLQVSSELRSALLLEAAQRIASGAGATLGELAGTNPMALLLQPPGNYIGVLDSPGPDDVPGHAWYYDPALGRLVYRVGRYTRFEPLGGPPDRVELQVSLVYHDRDGNGVYEPGRDELGGLRLDSVRPFRWSD
jgi:prepilin-type N-terminal cleavage/methylation domain-containing protein